MEKILKFGGTSCGSIVSIQSVISIIESNFKAQTKFAVVFSAMSGVTNQLLEAGNLASKRKNTDNSIIEDIENRHFEIIKHFIPVKGQSQVIAQIRNIKNSKQLPPKQLVDLHIKTDNKAVYEKFEGFSFQRNYGTTLFSFFVSE